MFILNSKFLSSGLLKGDKLLATCPIKLQPLENSSTIHDAFDVINRLKTLNIICLIINIYIFKTYSFFNHKTKLYDGRRQIGGKLEVKIRIREPLLHKQVQVSEHKWLVIDNFKNAASSTAAPAVTQKF